jgi:citrate lyase subunit beta/citryl-CoA lyase
MGFDGKTLIHPKTIEIANRVFAPSAKEVDGAQRIIAAHAAAVAAGKGVVVVDGKLVENLHVQNARRMVDLATAIGQIESRG